MVLGIDSLFERYDDEWIYRSLQFIKYIHWRSNVWTLPWLTMDRVNSTF